MEFAATEMGFKDGLGSASNSKSTDDYHYVLFGKQVDNQHSKYSGIYFEFDSQRNGSVNKVTTVIVGHDTIEFVVEGIEEIKILRSQDESDWNNFLKGVSAVFENKVIRRKVDR